MNFGKRLQTAIAMCNLSVPQVARATDVPVPTINALIRRDSKRTEYMESLIACLNPSKVNVEWVRSGRGSPDPIGQPAKLSSTEDMATAITTAMIRIPRIAVAKAGDIVRVVTLESESVDISTNWLQGSVTGRASGLSWSEQNDASMSGFINKGDRYLIDASQQSITAMAIYSVVIDGQEMTRALDTNASGQIEVHSISQDGQRQQQTMQKTDVRIIGRVIFHWGLAPSMRAPAK